MQFYRSLIIVWILNIHVLFIFGTWTIYNSFGRVGHGVYFYAWQKRIVNLWLHAVNAKKVQKEGVSQNTLCLLLSFFGAKNPENVYFLCWFND